MPETAARISFTRRGVSLAAAGTWTGSQTFSADTIVSNGSGLIVGHTAQVTGAAASEFQVLGSALADSSMIVGAFSADAVGSEIALIKSRNASVAGNTIVADNDVVGRIAWLPADGVDFATVAATFHAEVEDGSPAAGDIGMAFAWSQMPGGAGAIAETMRLTAGGTLFINATTNGKMTKGLTVSGGDNDNEHFALKNSDIGHGLTDIAETDTFLSILKLSSANGGANIYGINDGGTYAIVLDGRAVATNTAKTTSAIAPVLLRAAAHDGSNNGASISSDGNIVVIQDSYSGAARFLFDIEGSGHADVEFTTYDDHDDLALIDGLQNVMTGRMTPARYGANSMYYDREYLESTGIVGKDSWHTEVRDDGRVQQRQMINFTKLSMLHHGALLQVGDRLLALEQENTALRGQLATAGVLPEA